jgi:alpha-D-ribose 1-methylphosphonate 5-triphosphate synthase subunit PhnH
MIDMMSTNEIFKSFADPVLDSQRVFRAALKALSRPGLIIDLPSQPGTPGPLYPAVAALALTLFDLDTLLWLDAALDVPEVRDFLRFHCGARFTGDPAQAAFGIIGRGDSFSGLNRFNQGRPAYPDRSTTLIIQVAGFNQAPPKTLTGPGIDGQTQLKVDGLAESFWTEWPANHQGFPLGVDCFLTAPLQICGLPRTTAVEV